MSRRRGQGHKIAFRALLRGQFAGGIEYGISHRILGRQFAQILVDDVADKFEVDRANRRSINPFIRLRKCGVQVSVHRAG